MFLLSSASIWFSIPQHIAGFVLIFVSLGLLLIRKLYYNKNKEKYNAKIDITFKVSALIVMLIACILSVL